LLQIKRPSKYDAHTALMLGPGTSDPTIDLRGLVMVKQAGAGAGAAGEMGMPVTGRYERNWNTLYVGGLPMDWGEMQVREVGQKAIMCCCCCCCENSQHLSCKASNQRHMTPAADGLGRDAG
jgi:hypothetical protein